jgi:hypothetical protein
MSSSAARVSAVRALVMARIGRSSWAGVRGPRTGAVTSGRESNHAMDAGLLVTDRVGRRLTYARTPLGEQLTQSS